MTWLHSEGGHRRPSDSAHPKSRHRGPRRRLGRARILGERDFVWERSGLQSPAGWLMGDRVWSRVPLRPGRARSRAVGRTGPLREQARSSQSHFPGSVGGSVLLPSVGKLAFPQGAQPVLCGGSPWPSRSRGLLTAGDSVLAPQKSEQRTEQLLSTAGSPFAVCKSQRLWMCPWAPSSKPPLDSSRGVGFTQHRCPPRPPPSQWLTTPVPLLGPQAGNPGGGGAT